MSGKSTIIINFPVKPHVYKFLQKKVGEKLVVTKNDLYGNLVLDILSKRYCVLESVTDAYTFPVEISLRYMEDYGIFIDQKIIRKFNSQVDRIFKEEVRSYVSLNHTLNHIPKKTAVEQFIFHYNLTEDDIKLETILKDLVRNL
ncbi:hypothetical protein AB9T89_10350 [Flavobacterium oncorhynchi]|uniref:hypothetical protein n=1 Tax=Flavobacterium oncorhynchi TaxID=728056 RepID=UPI003519F1EC